MSRKTAFAWLVGIITAITLASCGSSTPAHSDGPPPEFFQERYQKLKDGRTILCLYREEDSYGYSKAVVDCDWAGAIVHK